MQHVICFGNFWRGDDGFGIHVCRRLNAGHALPKYVRIFEAGVAGLQALPYFEGCQKAIIVDGLSSAGNVGAVHRLEADDLSDPETEFSLHNFGVNHLLKLLPIYMGAAAIPRIVVIGAEVSTNFGLSEKLTAALATGVNAAVERVITECMS